MKPGIMAKWFCAVLCAGLLLAPAAPPAFARLPVEGRSQPVPENRQRVQFTSAGRVLGRADPARPPSTNLALELAPDLALNLAPDLALNLAPDLALDLAPDLAPDLALTWNTFLGGGGYDQYGSAIAVDAGGNVYIAGESMQPWSCAPVDCTVRPFTSSYQDAFVAKLDPSGKLIWNTFLGAGSGDWSKAIVVDDNGGVFVLGSSNGQWSCSPIPCTVRQTSSGLPDFVARLNASDGVLQWNTFLDGALSLYGAGMALDGEGDIYVAGKSFTGWSCSPVPCTIRRFTTGPNYVENDAYVAKLAPNGVLLWNTFLGGTGDDFGKDIAVDANEHVFVTGISNASWGDPVRPFTLGEDQYHHNQDAFAARLDASGVLQWNTFLGGGGDEESGYGFGGLVADRDGNSYVVGESTAAWSCATLRCTVRPFAPDQEYYNSDAFVAKIDLSGELLWNTFLGCSWDDDGNTIALDANDDIYVAGASSGAWGWPIVDFTDNGDAFVAKLKPDGALQWNTFLGGGHSVEGAGITLDRAGNLYVAGQSGDTWGAPVRAFSGGSSDVFVAKLPFSISSYTRVFLPLIQK